MSQMHRGSLLMMVLGFDKAHKRGTGQAPQGQGLKSDSTRLYCRLVLAAPRKNTGKEGVPAPQEPRLRDRPASQAGVAQGRGGREGRSSWARGPGPGRGAGWGGGAGVRPR